MEGLKRTATGIGQVIFALDQRTKQENKRIQCNGRKVVVK